MKRLLSFVLAACLLLSVAPVALAVEPMTDADLLANFAALEQNIFATTKSPYGYAVSANSSTLSWAASYMLEAYVHMYEATSDAKYLKSLGDQFRQSVKTLRDDLGNGSIGWDCPNYSVEKIGSGKDNVNTTFETTLGSVWTLAPGSTADNVQITTSGYSGKGLLVVGSAGSPQGAQTTIRNYAGGYSYSFRFMLKTATEESAKITLVDSVTGTPVSTLEGETVYRPGTNSTWKSFEVRYILPKTGNPLTLTLGSDLGMVYFDTTNFGEAAQFVIHESMVCAPAAEFIRFVKKNPTLAAMQFDATSTFNDVADEFLPVIEQIVHKWDPQWRDVDATRGLYIWPMDESGSAGNPLPHNQYIKMASVLLPLYDVTGNAEYLRKATNMFGFFKSKMQLIDRNGVKFYYWHYYDRAFPTDTGSEGVEDTSHGAIDLEAAITAYQYGIVFDEQDMQYLAETFRQALWNGNVNDPVLYSNLRYDSHSVLTSELNIRDWVYLGRWDPNITDAVTAFFVKNGNVGTGHPAKLLTYAYAYQVLMGVSVNSVAITTEGSLSQTPGAESAVQFTAKLNDGVAESRYGQIVWTVTKNGVNYPFTGTGKTFLFTPPGVGTNVITRLAEQSPTTKL